MKRTHRIVTEVEDFTDEETARLHYLIGCCVEAIAKGNDPTYEVLSEPHVPLNTAKAKFPSATWELVPRTNMVKIVVK